MDEKSYLLKEKKLKLRYKKFFESNKLNIEYLEEKYKNYNFSNFTKENPNVIFSYVMTFGISAIVIYSLIKFDKKEFNEQLDIWKSLKNLN